MVVPVEQDGKFVEPTCSNVEEEENTRKGGLKEDQTQIINKIIVDMREFRSELPSLLHQRDMEIEPVTLLVSYLIYMFV
jgi:DNA excision repair protein ERCC-4